MRLMLVLLLASCSAFAQGVAGKWKATAEGPNGSMERTFDFKVDGEKLSGETLSSFAGKSTIANGKVSGDELTFTIVIEFQGEKMDVTYKGKVSGSAIKLTSTAAGNSFEWSGKKVE
ncbi:MAG: hypothetical protein JNK87_26955 [Bryobacterales bacterium]|nr:hypothetical protein [Bryobacterales bacterium]